MRKPGDYPAEIRATDVVVDGHAHPREAREIVTRSSRRGEVEIEQSNRDAIPEYDVFETHVVVADNRAAGFSVGHLIAPGVVDAVCETARRVVQHADQLRDRGQRVIRLCPGRE